MQNTHSVNAWMLQAVEVGRKRPAAMWGVFDSAGLPLLAGCWSAGSGSKWPAELRKVRNMVCSDRLGHRLLIAVRDARLSGRILVDLVSVRNGGRRDRGTVFRGEALVLTACGK